VKRPKPRLAARVRPTSRARHLSKTTRAANADPVKSEEKLKTTGDVGLTTNITRTKTAENALADTRRFFNAMMKGSPDSIYFKDLASRFILVNDAQARVLGVKESANAQVKPILIFSPRSMRGRRLPTSSTLSKRAFRWSASRNRSGGPTGRSAG
jgi:PAS domain-containing protein